VADLSAYTHQPATAPRKRVKRETIKEEPLTPLRSVQDTTKKSTPKSSKKPVIQLALDKPHPAPPKWEEQYRLIKKMREGIIAPVDNM
jgi:endonuclease-3